MEGLFNSTVQHPGQTRTAGSSLLLSLETLTITLGSYIICGYPPTYQSSIKFQIKNQFNLNQEIKCHSLENAISHFHHLRWRFLGSTAEEVVGARPGQEQGRISAGPGTVRSDAFHPAAALPPGNINTRLQPLLGIVVFLLQSPSAVTTGM